jgi:hypothetical protein
VNAIACNDKRREELGRLARGELDAGTSLSVLEHVETCAACSQELDFLSDVLAAIDSDQRELSPQRWIRWSAWCAGLAAAAALVFYLAPWRTDSGAGSSSRFGHPGAPHFVHGDVRGEDEGLARRFADAMSPYERREFSSARESLTRFLSSNTDHAPAHFYRAIAATELGDDAAARADFEWVEAHATGFLREHAQWQLANLHFRLGREGEAIAMLRELESGGGEFSTNAARALAEIQNGR